MRAFISLIVLIAILAISHGVNEVKYPSYLANAPKDSITDKWNMHNRECVSYTAYKVEQQYGYSTKYWGDAKQWPIMAKKAGIAIGYTPRDKSVAIYPYSKTGHAMWVEKAYKDGSIRISEYNYDGDGYYDQMGIMPDNRLVYIYF